MRSEKQTQDWKGNTRKMEEKKMFGINGMEQNDVGALTPEQQQKLNEFKVTFRLRWEENKPRWSGVTIILKSYHDFFVHD